jgi:hypothetical protein
MANTSTHTDYYRANRSGHAPGHLRNALIECLARWTTGEIRDWREAPDEEVLSF